MRLETPRVLGKLRDDVFSLTRDASKLPNDVFWRPAIEVSQSTPSHGLLQTRVSPKTLFGGVPNLK